MANSKKVDIVFSGVNDVSPIVNDIVDDIDSIRSSSSTISFDALLSSATQVLERVQQVAQGIFDLSKSGVYLSLVTSEFGKISKTAGFDAVDGLDKLRDAARGTINDFALITAANKAFTLKVTDNVDQLASLMEIADARANRLGGTTEAAFDDIVTGIGRESKQILDNLGIIIDIDQATKSYAETVGKTADQLSAMERKQAIIAQITADSADILKDLGGAANENAGAIESLSASFENLKLAIGQAFAPDVIDNAKIFSGIFDGLRSVVDGINTNRISGYKDELKQLQVAFADVAANGSTNLFGQDNTQGQLKLFADQIAIVKERLRSLGVDIDAVSASEQTWNQETEAAAKGLGILDHAAENAANSAFSLSDAAKLAGSGVVTLAGDTITAANAVTDLDAKIRSLNAATGAFSSGVSRVTNAIITQAAKAAETVGYGKAFELGQQALDSLDLQVRDLNTSLEDGSISALQMGLTFSQIEDQLTAPFSAIEEQNKAAQQAMKQSESAAKSFASTAQQAFDQLQSKISGVLQGALSSDVFSAVPFDQLLPRQDDINEDARRLADVAIKGYDSPWADYLHNKFPNLFDESSGDVKQQAASILKDFQAGLVPELIDKETAKERVRRMLVGEAKLKDLATEIAQELQGEFGNLGLDQIQSIAGQALGIKDSIAASNANPIAINPQLQLTDTGNIESFANSFSNSFIDTAKSTINDAIVDLIQKATAAENVIEQAIIAGKQNGEGWGNGFLAVVGDNIPKRLIDILSLLVLPNIENLLNQTATQQAAR